MIENNLLSIIIFAPLAGAVINWLIGGKLKNEMFSGLVACGTIAVSTHRRVHDRVRHRNAASRSSVRSRRQADSRPPLDVDTGRRFPCGFRLWEWTGCRGIYACFITFVGLLIHIFATGYMHGDKGFYRFFAYLNLFMFSMLTLILADNFLLMFVGWEGVGLCSYLLIGYYIKQDEAREAAKKAFVMNRIGDWGVLIGVFLVFTLTGSISFYDKAVDGRRSSKRFHVSSHAMVGRTVRLGNALRRRHHLRRGTAIYRSDR